ncbi:DUF3887 domain-containing protein (plasmid) [Streptomyces sp. NBC_00536]|uniref:DUF3887 domain-containing protein n=1 Tax=Streptomyces sp. NBC_00536 TaxID=2975769 RepID=UPI002E80ACBF|nr:DUF3887 domain-containing protein [Streptomyces sp. NBC_00536]WUC84086.1 DUF3887 domain-containing protein [Streptomyces sp. NBC_00536]
MDTSRRTTWRRLVLLVPAAVLATQAPLLTSASALDATPQTQTQAHPAATAPAQPQDDKQLALDTLDEVVQGNFTAVSARFTEPLRPQAPPELLAKSWQDYQQAFGSYQSHGDPTQVTSGDQTVVSVPLQMAKQPGEFRVTFNNNGQLTGLFFLRTGVPVPLP